MCHVVLRCWEGRFDEGFAIRDERVMLEFVILGSSCFCIRGLWMPIWMLEGGCVPSCCE